MRSVLTVPQGLDSQLTQLDTPVRRNQAAPRIVPADPRIFQILFLGVLLAAGGWLRDFSLHPPQIVLTFAAGLGTQHALSLMHGHVPVSYRSALITALGLTLLLRAHTLWAHPLAATAAISSKFLFRWKRKHIFNPANFGVIFALCALPGTWVSPGQWGQDITFAGWLLMLGAVISHRARRADISWSFLVIYLGLIAIRVAWLGQRWAAWTHQFGNGALLLFAFFMISDPMTIPNSRDGRLVHAASVAIFAYVWQFEFYRINGFLWALISASPLVPVWDVLGPARKFEWTVQGGNEMSKKRIGAARRHRRARMHACNHGR
jgi:enediyne biosynthesis protein E5